MIQRLKNTNPVLATLLVFIFAILSCCLLPSQILYWTLCTDQDRNIPANTEVLVSSCKRPTVIGMPGGEVLFVREGNTGDRYLLDLRSGEHRTIADDPLFDDHGIFLSPELVWLEGSHDKPGYRPEYILDLVNGKRYELSLARPQRDNNGNFETAYYPYFTGADKVFIDPSRNTLIVLSHDFKQNPESNVIIFQSSDSSDIREGEMLEKFLKDLGVDYELIDFSLEYVDVPSPTGKYIVRRDGIYLSVSEGPLMLHAMRYYFKGWYYDETGVVIRQSGYSLITLPGTSSLYYIPGPVIKLRLSE